MPLRHAPYTQNDHDELRRLGHDVHVDKGDGYFYVLKGDANNWLDRTVNVAKVGSLTLEQWGDGFNRLKKLNHQFAPARGARKIHTRNPPPNGPERRDPEPVSGRCW